MYAYTDKVTHALQTLTACTDVTLLSRLWMARRVYSQMNLLCVSCVSFYVPLGIVVCIYYIFCCCFVFSFVVDELYHYNQTISDCGQVNIIAFQARLFNASAIWLEWNTTFTENSEGCISIVGHYIKVSTYEDFYSYQHNTPSYVSPSEFTAKRLDTKFTLPLNATYTVKKFYTFQVHSLYFEGSIYQTAKYKSEVFYFDKPGE